MRKSKIDSYTSEELDQLPDESDWEANAAMTDEEIEAAIASDPDENKRSPDWLKRARAVQRKTGYLNTWHPRARVTILGETPKQSRVRLEEDAVRPNGRHVTAGTVTVVPKNDVVYSY
jgi:hypothetical protein